MYRFPRFVWVIVTHIGPTPINTGTERMMEKIEIMWVCTCISEELKILAISYQEQYLKFHY